MFDFTRFGVELTGCDILIEFIAALKFCVSSLFGYDGDVWMHGVVTCCCICQMSKENMKILRKKNETLRMAVVI